MMKKKYTPYIIKQTAAYEIFVFGSNPSGFHAGGASEVAMKENDAAYGRSEDLQHYRRMWL